MSEEQEMQLMRVKTAVDGLGRVYSMVAENPGYFEAILYLDGEVSGPPDMHHTITRNINGHATIYPLYKGERIWNKGSTNRDSIASIDLATGNVEYNELFDDMEDHHNLGSGYGTGKFGKDEIDYDEFKDLWQNYLETIKGVFAR